MVSFDLFGRPEVALIKLLPGDPAVLSFCRSLEEKLSRPSIIQSSFDITSPGILIDTFRKLGEAELDAINCLVIVTHGTQRHKAVFQDSSATSEADFDLLGDIGMWSRFHRTFDQRLVIFAICHSGDPEQVDLMFHQAFAAHVVTPHPDNPLLAVNEGATAIAELLNGLDAHGLDRISPEVISSAFDVVDRRHPFCLKLWKPVVSEDFQDEVLRGLERHP